MAIELSDYRERLGSSIHEVGSFFANTLADRLRQVFPEGYAIPQRVGHVMLAFMREGNGIVALPALPKFEYENGVALDTEFPQHGTIATELRESGIDIDTKNVAHGYVWGHQTSKVKRYGMLLLSSGNFSGTELAAITAQTNPDGVLHDHAVFTGLVGNQYSTFTVYAHDGVQETLAPPSMPDAMRQELYDIAHQQRSSAES